MNEEKEIFLPDTSIKLKNLKSKLNNVYELDLITKREKMIYIGILGILGGIILYKFLKK
jgi:hypothetical protein